MRYWGWQHEKGFVSSTLWDSEILRHSTHVSMSLRARTSVLDTCIIQNENLEWSAGIPYGRFDWMNLTMTRVWYSEIGALVAWDSLPLHLFPLQQVICVCIFVAVLYVPPCRLSDQWDCVLEATVGVQSSCVWLLNEQKSNQQWLRSLNQQGYAEFSRGRYICLGPIWSQRLLQNRVLAHFCPQLHLTEDWLGPFV